MVEENRIECIDIYLANGHIYAYRFQNTVTDRLALLFSLKRQLRDKSLEGFSKDIYTIVYERMATLALEDQGFQ